MKLLLLIGFLFSIKSFAQEATFEEIIASNNQVLAIENRLESDSTRVARIQLGNGYNINPNKYMFYYIGDRIICIKIEIIINERIIKYSYYFRNDFPLKYVREITKNNDPIAQTAIVYGWSGKIIWKNVETPDISFEQLMAVFKNVIPSIMLLYRK